MAWETTQQTLLSRMQDPADHAAWREFDRRYGELITSFARRQGLQFSDAEDIRQIVMMNLARSFKRFEYQPAKGRFRSYLGRVVRHAISQWWARPNRADRALETFILNVAVDDGSDSDTAAREAWEAEWVNHHLRSALRTIRRGVEPSSMEVFDELLAGRSVQQVAESRGMSTDAVHKIKQRIRERLKRQVSLQIQDEELITRAG